MSTPPGRRDGLRTTEFLLSAGTVALCGVAAFMTDAAAVALGAAVATSIGYQFARAWVKAARIRVDK